MKKKRKTLISVVGLFGSVLWVLTIVLRGTELVQIDAINFLLGVLPNFGVSLLLPMILILYYPMVYKQEISHVKYRYSLIAIFGLLLMIEIFHDLFFSSRFDIFDLVASLIGLGIMALLYNDS